jgi:integrase
LTLHQFLADYYAPLHGISDRTIKIYGITIRKFAEFLGVEPTVEDHFDELVMARFLSHRLRTRSVGTAAKDRAQLHALSQFAAKRGLCKWPTMRTIRAPQRVPRAWLIDEFRRLVAACDGEHGEVCGVRSSLWFSAILQTAYWTGERVGGLLALEWHDIEPQAVVFRAETRKGQRADIYRPITPECYAAIMAIKTKRKLVFDWDRSYTLIWYRLGKICERAGLPNDRMSKFHRVRKTCASYYAAGGGDPQTMMGHTSPAVTKLYLDPRIVTPDTSAPDVLPRIVSEPPPGDSDASPHPPTASNPADDRGRDGMDRRTA